MKRLQATAPLQQQLENTLLVSVGDREAEGQPGLTVIWGGWQRLQEVAKFKVFNLNN